MAYPGGKSQEGVYHKLISLMPPHRAYIEPFLGGGAILQRKRPAEVNIGIDLDPDVISRWSTRAGIAIFTDPAAGRIHAAEAPMDDRHSVSSDHAGNGERGSGGNGRSTDAGLRYEFLCTDALEFLRSHRFSADDLIYCDPPYLLSARTSCNENYYAREMTDVQHRDLLRILRQLKCRVMISGYSSHLYDKLLDGWHVTTYTAWTHRHEARTEYVWHNYPAPTALHDYRFLGSNFRERDNLKRQQKRWKERLRRMPVLQRQALLAAIADIG